MSISPQNVSRRTLKGNVTSKGGNFRVWHSDDGDFSSFGSDSFDGELLTFRGAEAVEGDSEGVPGGGFDFCEQVWVPVLEYVHCEPSYLFWP